MTQHYFEVTQAELASITEFDTDAGQGARRQLIANYMQRLINTLPTQHRVQFQSMDAKKRLMANVSNYDAKAELRSLYAVIARSMLDTGFVPKPDLTWWEKAVSAVWPGYKVDYAKRLHTNKMVQEVVLIQMLSLGRLHAAIAEDEIKYKVAS